MRNYQGPAKIVRDGKVVTTAILHCLAVPTDWWVGKTSTDIKRAVYQWHVKQRAFSDIGYHYIVMPSGEIIPCRSVALNGAHTLGQNYNTIGIAMVEMRKITKIANASAYYSPATLASVKDVLRYHHINNVYGHNDYDSYKLCPGFKVGPHRRISTDPLEVI